MIPAKFKFGGHRNSYAELNEIYFWTITVRNHSHLLHKVENKLIILNSLQWLVQNQFVEIYGYVIMPNHIHLIWQQLKMNGKEFPKNSFAKFTSKSLLSKLENENCNDLKKYEVIAPDRKYNIWQRDPLAIWIYSKEMAIQKLDYTHFNPCQPHWNLCDSPENYGFSSYRFYEYGIDEYNILKNIMEVF